MESHDVTPRRPPGLRAPPQRVGESSSSDRSVNEEHEFSTMRNGQPGKVAPEPAVVRADERLPQTISDLELQGELDDDEPNDLKHVLVIART